MATSQAMRPAIMPVAAMVVLRILGAAGLLGMAYIQYHLWMIGYHTVSLIGPLYPESEANPDVRIGAAAIAQRVLGPEAKVVSAFHNVAAHKLATDEEVDCDVLVFGDDKAARAVVVALVEDCGLRGLHAEGHQ